MPEQIDFIHEILTEIELTMRERLKDIGVDLPHIVVASDSTGNALVLGDIDPVSLKKMAEELIKRADQDLRRKHGGEPGGCGSLGDTRDVATSNMETVREKTLVFLDGEIKNRTDVLAGIRDAWFRFRVKGHDATEAHRLDYEARVQKATELLALLRAEL
jgi:hypothetical protein